MSPRPYSDSKLAKYVAKRTLELRAKGKSQMQIATEAGFPNANMIAMIKNGAAKLSIDRVPALAKALECDPRYLFSLALEQKGGDMSEAVIKDIFGVVVTRNEAAWIEALRNASDHKDPRLTTRSLNALRAIF
jgi:transcriptional regulator with XRE-family HTH domain